MADSRNDFAIGKALVVVTLGLFVVGIVASFAVIGAATVDSLGDSNSVEDVDASSSDIAWVDVHTWEGSNSTEVTAYNKDDDILWQSKVTNGNFDSDGTTLPISVVRNSEHVYVASNNQLYTFDASSGDLVDREEHYSGRLALDPYGNTIGLDHKQLSQSKDTYYEIAEDGTITVSEMAYDGDGDYSKSSLTTIDTSSYEDERLSSTGVNDIYAATDDYVVVSVRMYGQDDGIDDLHVIDRDTGESVYEIENVGEQSQRAVAKSDGTILINAVQRPSTSDTEYYVEFDSNSGTILTEKMGDRGSVDYEFR